MGTATCLTASCTTGWTDWIHGELWLLPHDGLLRVPSPLGKTIVHGFRPRADSAVLTTRTMSLEDAEETVLRGAKAVWIPRQDIATAHLKSGPLSDSLRVHRKDGTTVTLLWLRSAKAKDALRCAWSLAWWWAHNRLTANRGPSPPSRSRWSRIWARDASKPTLPDRNDVGRRTTIWAVQRVFCVTLLHSRRAPPMAFKTSGSVRTDRRVRFPSASAKWPLTRPNILSWLLRPRFGEPLGDTVLAKAWPGPRAETNAEVPKPRAQSRQPALHHTDSWSTQN